MIEVLKQALEALETPKPLDDYPPILNAYAKTINNAIASLRQAIAEWESQEPVAWKHPDKNMVFWEDTKEVDEYHGFKPTIPLYIHPSQRTWVGLTNDDLTNLLYDTNLGQQSAVLQAIALLKEKNT